MARQRIATTVGVLRLLMMREAERRDNLNESTSNGRSALVDSRGALRG
jgi:hypothetical protein